MRNAKFDKLTKRLAKNNEAVKKMAGNFKGDIVETIKNEKGDMLYQAVYPFSHLSAIGEKFVMNKRQYEVVSCVKNGNEITTVVQ